MNPPMQPMQPILSISANSNRQLRSEDSNTERFMIPSIQPTSISANSNRQLRSDDSILQSANRQMRSASSADIIRPVNRRLVYPEETEYLRIPASPSSPEHVPETRRRVFT
jgi:hypothetical protein